MCERYKSGRARTIKGIDKCLYPFINFLKRNQIHTQFSCCGHGSENPHIIVLYYSDVVKILQLFHTWSANFIDQITPMDCERWNITFNGLVCTPPRYPCWVDSKYQVKFINYARKVIFQGALKEK